MENGNPPDTSETRADQIREIVDRDYRRVDEADNPWAALGVERGAAPSEINAKFEQYEQFYRVENFERFEDNELTRKALEIRKKLSRAVVELQGNRQIDPNQSGFQGGPAMVASVDEESSALAEIYFRDGITWLKLEDLSHALECFQRSMDHDPSRGVTLAYHAYTQFQRAPDDDEVRHECRESFRTASIIEPKNPDIHVLKTRFALYVEDPAMVEKGLNQVRTLNPEHPAVGELRRLYDEMVD